MKKLLLSKKHLPLGKFFIFGAVILCVGVASIFVIGLGKVISSTASPKASPETPPSTVNQTYPEYGKSVEKGTFGPPNLGRTGSNDLHQCAGNETDECIGAPSIDFYPGGSEDATNPEYKGDVGGGKEIMGRITSTNDKTIILHTSSGRDFTVGFPVDPVKTFNTERSQYYQNLTVGTGDMIYVWYTEAVGQSNTIIPSSQMYRSSLLIKLASDFKTNPDAPTQKY